MACGVPVVVGETDDQSSGVLSAKYAASNNPISTNHAIDLSTNRIQPISIPNSQITISATMIQPIVDARTERGFVDIDADATRLAPRRRRIMAGRDPRVRLSP